MKLEPTPEQERLAEAAREFSDEVLAPAAARHEADEHIPRAIFQQLGERRLMSVNGLRTQGGAEAGTVAYALAMMEISRGCASTAVTMAVTNMVGEVIASFGTEAQRDLWCPRLAAGEYGAFGLSEVGAGSDPGGMLTTATEDGDGWILRGSKQWISHGDEAAVVVVWARTDGPGSRGLSCFLVSPEAEGFSVGKHEEKMGLRASHTVALAFDDVRLPADALLGPRGAGFRIAMMALDGGRIGIASQAVGIAEGAYRHALAFARRGETDQAALFRLADMRTRIDAARLLALRAAKLKEAGKPFTQEASIAKAFSSESAWWVCNRAVESVLDEGLTRGTVAERALRDVRVSMIYEGTSEVQRIVIGRGLTA